MVRVGLSVRRWLQLPHPGRLSRLDIGSNEGVSVLQGMAYPKNVESIPRLPGDAYSIQLGLGSHQRLDRDRLRLSFA